MRSAEFISGHELYREFQASPYYRADADYLDLLQGVASFLKDKNLTDPQRRTAIRKLVARIRPDMREQSLGERELAKKSASWHEPPSDLELFKLFAKTLYTAKETDLAAVLDRVNLEFLRSYGRGLTMNTVRKIAMSSGLNRALWRDAVAKWKSNLG